MTHRPAHRMLTFRPSSLAFSLAMGVALAGGLTLPVPAQAGIGVGIAITVAPPPLPVYEQPIMPGMGYLWVPGYWAYDPSYGYYWVPGTWVMPPYVGALWTPGYWFWGDGIYRFHRGYWGSRVGFYGGINYGYGYNGDGYDGGYWRGRNLYYNRTVNNFGNVHVTNVYNRTVIENHGPRTSFNGGQGGIQMRPTAQQSAFARQQHTAPMAIQQQHQQQASQNPGMRFSQNRGNPSVPAMSRPGPISNGPQAPNHQQGAPSPALRHGPVPGVINPPRATPAPSGRPFEPQNRPAPSMQPEQRPGMQAPMRPQEQPRMQAPPRMQEPQPPHMNSRPPQEAPRMAPSRPPENQGHPQQARPQPQGHPNGDHGGDHRDDHHGG